MQKIWTLLNDNTKIDVEIVYSTDDICRCCPKMMDENLCDTDKKVKEIDNKVVQYFDIVEDKYVYGDIVDHIKSRMTADAMDEICGSCEWYGVSKCKENILKKD